MTNEELKKLQMQELEERLAMGWMARTPEDDAYFDAVGFSVYNVGILYMYVSKIRLYRVVCILTCSACNPNLIARVKKYLYMRTVYFFYKLGRQLRCVAVNRRVCLYHTDYIIFFADFYNSFIFFSAIFKRYSAIPKVKTAYHFSTDLIGSLRAFFKVCDM